MHSAEKARLEMLLRGRAALPWARWPDPFNSPSVRHSKPVRKERRGGREERAGERHPIAHLLTC